MKKYLSLLLSFLIIDPSFATRGKRDRENQEDAGMRPSASAKKKNSLKKQCVRSRALTSDERFIEDMRFSLLQKRSLAPFWLSENTFLSFYRFKHVKSSGRALKMTESELTNNEGQRVYAYDLKEDLDPKGRLIIHFDEDAPVSSAHYNILELREKSGFHTTDLCWDYYFDTKSATLKIQTSAILKFLSIRFSGMESLEDSRNTFTLYTFNPKFFKKGLIKNKDNIKDLMHRRREFKEHNMVSLISAPIGKNLYEYTVNLDRVFDSQIPGRELTASHMNIFDLFMPKELIEINASKLQNGSSESSSSNKRKAKSIRVPERPSIPSMMRSAGNIIDQDIDQQRVEPETLSDDDADTSLPSSPDSQRQQQRFSSSFDVDTSEDEIDLETEMRPRHRGPNILDGYEIVPTSSDTNACSLYAFYGSLNPEQTEDVMNMRGEDIRKQAAREISNAVTEEIRDHADRLSAEGSLAQFIIHYACLEHLADNISTWNDFLALEDMDKARKLRDHANNVVRHVSWGDDFERDDLIYLMAKIHGVNVSFYKEDGTSFFLEVDSGARELPIHFESNHFSMLRVKPTQERASVQESTYSEDSHTKDEADFSDSTNGGFLDPRASDSQESHDESNVDDEEQEQEDDVGFTPPLGADVPRDQAISISKAYGRACALCFAKDISDEEKLRVVNETLAHKREMNSKQLANLYYLKAFNMKRDNTISNEEKLRALNEALTHEKGMNAQQLAFLYERKAFHMNWDKSISNEERLSALNEALKYKSNLTRTQLANLYERKAFYMNLDKSVSDEERLRALNEALKYKSNLTRTQLANLYERKAFYMSCDARIFNRSLPSEIKLDLISAALSTITEAQTYENRPKQTQALNTKREQLKRISASLSPMPEGSGGAVGAHYDHQGAFRDAQGMHRGYDGSSSIRGDQGRGSPHSRGAPGGGRGRG